MTSTMEWPTFDMNDPLGVLVKLSRYYGSDPRIVLAGGGNTSAKIDGNLFVKASGFALATIPPEGFVEMRRQPLLDLLDADLPDDVDAREELYKQASLAARVRPELGQRPSVECMLHNLIPGTFIVHSHATWVNMITSCVRGEQLAGELFGDEILWAPFVDPGIILARTLRDLLADYTERTGRKFPRAVLMQSHGLIVAADTPQEIRENTDWVIDKVRDVLGEGDLLSAYGAAAPRPTEQARLLIETVAPALRGLLADADASALPVVTFDDSERVLSLVAAPQGEQAAVGGALNPDQIVYCKCFPLWVSPKEGEDPAALIERLRKAVANYRTQRGFAPTVVLVESLGMFAAGRDFTAADTAREVYTDAILVMAGAKTLGGIRHLPRRDAEFIENWELESYRRKVAAGAGARGRAEGKVAVITGAARGFGREIAGDLAAQGAHVALGDVNLEGACEAASSIVAQTKKGRALGLAMNVAEAASVAEALHQVIRTYGGLDVFVSNAGVLRAESVKTQSEADFNFVTDVNYKGYFLCVRKAAQLLAVQHAARPDYLSDIIQVNSKSGLLGSNRNFAYAGSKFGGIGLTQSFALELIEDGIKVNAVCPGNFFDGPLWSDPEGGLFVQYLQAGKVPGARTVDDVRRHYEKMIPMRRGCRAADVMEAIYYLMAQQYETGQAVPVTGGQVMLH
jgi:rhamnose utilization protein RhaD (predicted bifunctional aldolase and dehydrogenase)/NAD(P)-dependent dehydrogenase (short-subunit alcohol dehydrogenase family)